MKLERQAQKALFVHLGCLVAGALLCALLGRPNHYMLGISLGSLLATMIPGLWAEVVLKRKPAPTDSLTQLNGAVFNNRWITSDENREAVQEIRGQVYITWFGVMIGTLIAGYAIGTALPGCALAAAVGGTVFWLISRCFS